MEIYRNKQTFAFKVLQECSFSTSRNDTVQMRMFFLTPDRKMLAGKFCKVRKVFGCVARAYYF